MTADEARALFDYDPATGVIRKRGNGRPVGFKRGKGYVGVAVNGRAYYAHRLAFLIMTGRWPEPTCDHRDSDRANNAWRNLREATILQQNANRKPRCKLGIKGVRPNGPGFSARIGCKGKSRHLGTYPTVVEAALAYTRAALELFGEEFARTL